MKYVTKEIYETMQATDLHLLLRVSAKASQRDEAFFAKLYGRKEAEFLVIAQSAANMTFDDLYPEEFEVIADDYEDEGIDPEKIKAEYFAEREEARKHWQPEVYDETKCRRDFRKFHKSAMSELERVLPEEIKAQVADMRVLALDVCTKEVKRAIAAFCKENERAVNRAFRNLEKAERRAFGDYLPDFVGESLHDCVITSMRKQGNNIVLRLDNSGGFTDVSAVVFKKAKIVQQDVIPRGCVWLYDEIYRTKDGGLEVHALLWKKGTAHYLTILCADTEFMC